MNNQISRHEIKKQMIGLIKNITIKQIGGGKTEKKYTKKQVNKIIFNAIQHIYLMYLQTERENTALKNMIYNSK